jgi:hypothetical protein
LLPSLVFVSKLLEGAIEQTRFAIFVRHSISHGQYFIGIDK